MDYCVLNENELTDLELKQVDRDKERERRIFVYK